MKFFIYFFFINLIIGSNCDDFESTSGHLTRSSRQNSEDQANSVRDLISRILPEQATYFKVVVDSSQATDEKDFFRSKSENGTVNIFGTTGVAAASGFNYYSKYYCNCHISWEASQLNVPQPLPTANVEIKFNDRFRYYQNVCTTSYSFVWWDWKKWEEHIDWMVMNSFNLVSAFNGQEALWSQVYQDFGSNQEEIDDYFTGPAFSSWLRMGNVRKWGGSLSQSWHQRSLTSQKRIISRLRSFGVIAVLPAFAGHLPRAFRRLYPEANMVKLGSWNTFNDTYCCPYFLDPTEELFEKIGRNFIQKQIAAYGTDNIYSCDSFNENTPPSTDSNYLANVSSSIFKAMAKADPKAVWLMQNWLFVHDAAYWTKARARASLTAVPKARMIISDSQSEQFPQYISLEQYFGQPFIWCMLHNFGGTLGMFGNSDIINERPIEARTAENSTMIGSGLTMEGINQNYIIYELMTETAWRNKPANLSEWFADYSVRRYGVHNQLIKQSWQYFQKTIYNSKTSRRMRGQYAISKTPSWSIKPWMWYDYREFLVKMSEFSDAQYQIKDLNYGYYHDMIDMSRQGHQVMFDVIYDQMKKAFRKKQIESFQLLSNAALYLLTNVNRISYMDSAFCLDEWIKSARDAGSTPGEKDSFEYNARNQVSLWGPKGEIMNYAIKQWNGVVSDFMFPRWQIFIDYSNGILVKNGTFNETYIRKKMFEMAEEPFTFKKAEPFKKSSEKFGDLSKWKEEKWWKMFEIFNEKNSRGKNDMYRLDWKGVKGLFEQTSFVEDEVEVIMVKK